MNAAEWSSLVLVSLGQREDLSEKEQYALLLAAIESLPAAVQELLAHALNDMVHRDDKRRFRLN